jgi:hypothetical protein
MEPEKLGPQPLNLFSGPIYLLLFFICVQLFLDLLKLLKTPSILDHFDNILGLILRFFQDFLAILLTDCSQKFFNFFQSSHKLPKYNQNLSSYIIQ